MCAEPAKHILKRHGNSAYNSGSTVHQCLNLVCHSSYWTAMKMIHISLLEAKSQILWLDSSFVKRHMLFYILLASLV